MTKNKNLKQPLKMKTSWKKITAALAILLMVTTGALATSGVQLTIENGTNAILHWASQTNQAFIVGYRASLDATTPWVLLTNTIANTNTTQQTLTNRGAIAASSSGFYVVSQFAEDFDRDGIDNQTELLVGTDPFLADNDGDASYPSAPSVFFGEVIIYYDTNSSTAGNLGPFLYANSVTANSMVTTEPNQGELHLKWNSDVIDHANSFNRIRPKDASPTPNFTAEEAKLLQDAFGQGTSITRGIISTPDQAKVNALPIELLKKYEEFSIAQIDFNFKQIQAINSGAKQGSVNAHIASIHTQWTREQSICRSLTSRIGRAAGKVLPLLGGIFVIANAALNAQDFIDTAQAYAHDILTGDDETGDAAIFAGVCNNIAPGSSNIVLGYLLR